MALPSFPSLPGASTLLKTLYGSDTIQSTGVGIAPALEPAGPERIGNDRVDTAFSNDINGSSSKRKFPVDLGEQTYFELSFYELVRGQVDQKIMDNPIFPVIILPVPANLAEAFGMRYNDVEIGAVLGHLAKSESTNDVIRAARGVASQGINPGTIGALKKGVKELVSGTAANGAFGADLAKIAGRGVVKSMDDGAGALIDQLIGGVPNPNLSLMFQGHGFRSFNFNWRLSPRNIRESGVLNDIIIHIKKCIHPGKDGLFFTFPLVAQIRLVIGGRGSEFIRFKKGVIESFNVNYTPNGVPAFFSATNMPVEVEISLSFKEMELFTREDFVGWESEQLNGEG